MGNLIYIVEDDENIRELIKMALTSFSYDVYAFDNAEDVLLKIKKKLPQMLIMDIMLPGISGLEAMGKLRRSERTKQIPIVLLTARDTEFDKVTGLDGGADDYIVKPFGVMELGARIRSIFRRLDNEPMNNAQKMKAADLFINLDTRETTKNGKHIDLTYKEFELLWILMREKDRIVTREELLNLVWGYEFMGESRTLDMHIRTLRQKLGDDTEESRTIKTVRGVGYRFMDKGEKV